MPGPAIARHKKAAASLYVKLAAAFLYACVSVSPGLQLGDALHLDQCALGQCFHGYG